MSYPSLLTKDSLEVILCFTLSSVTLTVQSPNSNAANWGWPKGRPSVTTGPMECVTSQLPSNSTN